MKTLEQMIAVLHGLGRGEQIEQRQIGKSDWQLLHNPSPDSFHFGICEYRVKHEPKEWSVKVLKDGRIVDDRYKLSYEDRRVVEHIKVKEMV
jgi:hypothetical protein